MDDLAKELFGDKKNRSRNILAALDNEDGATTGMGRLDRKPAPSGDRGGFLYRFSSFSSNEGEEKEEMATA
jgi:hypothetical protein